MKAPEPPANQSEIRKHYFMESYVVIAPRRNKRPDLFSHFTEPHKALSAHCPFDHNAERSLWQYPTRGQWQVKVVPNAFPAISTDNPKAYGVQEVIINTPDHDAEFSELSIEHVENVFRAYANRLTELSKLEGIRYTLIFKNDGPIAGASIPHAHCQVYALPLIPPKIARESDALNHYWDVHNSCAYCDLIDWETKQKVRVIGGDKHVIAVAPYASSHGLEVWVMPQRHVSSITEFNATELRSLAVIMKKITASLDTAMISFNYFLQESLENQNHHFVIKIEPRISKYAGAEIGTGVEINPVSPEYATLWYRGKLPVNKAVSFH